MPGFYVAIGDGPPEAPVELDPDPLLRLAETRRCPRSRRPIPEAPGGPYGRSFQWSRAFHTSR